MEHKNQEIGYFGFAQILTSGLKVGQIGQNCEK